MAHVPGGHGDVVEGEPCGRDGAFRPLLVVVFLLLNRAVVLAGRHGTGGRVGKSGGGGADSWGWQGGEQQVHPSIYPPPARLSRGTSAATSAWPAGGLHHVSLPCDRKLLLPPV